MKGGEREVSGARLNLVLRVLVNRILHPYPPSPLSGGVIHQWCDPLASGPVIHRETQNGNQILPPTHQWRVSSSVNRFWHTHTANKDKHTENHGALLVTVLCLHQFFVPVLQVEPTPLITGSNLDGLASVI